MLGCYAGIIRFCASSADIRAKSLGVQTTIEQARQQAQENTKRAGENEGDHKGQAGGDEDFAGTKQQLQIEREEMKKQLEAKREEMKSNMKPSGKR